MFIKGNDDKLNINLYKIIGKKAMKKSKMLIPMVILLACISNAYAQDWTQYLGPDRNGTSPQKNLLRSWPQNGPEVLWTVNVGIGFGGPVIKDGKVYLLDRDDKVGDKLRCFDFSNGKELWSFSYDAPGSVMFPGSRSVPAIDGDRIYTCGPYGDLYCVNINTHKLVWHKNVWTDFSGIEIPRWAITQCPLVYGNLLIVASQAPKAGVVTYDKLNGTVKWQTEPIGPVGYVSPTIIKVSGEDHIVMISAAARGAFGQTGGGGKVVGINPQTGKILWKYTNWGCSIPVPCALDVGQGRVVITGGYNAGTAMIKVERKSDGTYGVTEVFKNPDVGSHTQPPVLANGNLYMDCSTNEKKDGLVCMGLDGQVHWKTARSPLFDKGGIILADGLLLATDGTTRLYLIQPDPSAFKPLASADLLKAGGTGSENDPMVIVASCT
jgi:outer membrane protein assembly factor BamB